MLRAQEHIFDASDFDNLTGIHDGNAVGRPGNHPHVVRNQEHGNTAFKGKVFNQINNLCLNGHI